jgi:tetratricopeptide (TPR) repeat protein
LDYTKYVVVLVEMGDRRTYEEFCRDFIKQFANTTDSSASERIIKLGSLYPPSASQLAALSPFAKLTAKSVPADPHLVPGDWPILWRYVSLALFEYRRGNYAEALHWGNLCLEFDRIVGHMPPRIASVQAISAMCYFRLGQHEQARSELAKSRALIEECSKTAFVSYDDGRGWWFDWFLARILEREAAATIDGFHPSSK